MKSLFTTVLVGLALTATAQSGDAPSTPTTTKDTVDYLCGQKGSAPSEAVRQLEMQYSGTNWDERRSATWEWAHRRFAFRPREAREAINRFNTWADCVRRYKDLPALREEENYGDKYVTFNFGDGGSAKGKEPISTFDVKWNNLRPIGFPWDPPRVPDTPIDIPDATVTSPTYPCKPYKLEER